MNQVKAPAETPIIGVAQISVLFPRLRQLAWLPVPAYIALIAILYITLSRELAASLVFDPPVLMLVSNTVFFFAISFAVFTAAMRAYLASGSSNILLLGCGVLALGGGALAGGWVRPLGWTANTSVTIHNLGVLLGATLHAMSALLTLLKVEPEQRAERRRQKLLFGFAGTLILIAIIIVATFGGIVPSFWAADAGSTPIKQVVLGMAVALFALTSIYTMVLYSQNRRYFLWWYSLGLALTCLGLVGITLMKAVGDPIGWAGRTAQYLGGAYFLIAALNAFREAQAQGLTLEMAIDRFYGRSEVYYRDLVDTVSEAIISMDEKKRVLLWNQGAEKVLGYTRSEVTGCLVSDLLMPEGHKERLDHELQDLQRKHGDQFASKELEIEMRRKDGTLFPSDTSLSMRRIGSSWIATLVVRDITERKRVEEALRESEEKYRTLVEQSLQGTWVIQDMRVVFCNQTFANMGGWTVDEVYSFSPEEVTNIIHPDDQKRVWGRFRERLEGKQLPLTNNQLRAFRKDGSIAWIEYDARRINFSGRPAMLISVVDITERGEAEKALRESEQRYRQLAESAQDFIFIIDKEGKVQYINSSGAKEFGSDPDQVLGRSVMELFLPETSQRQWDHIQNVIQSGHALLNSETKVVFPTREMWLNTSLIPLRAESGEVIQVLGIARDVTERKQSEEALLESEKRYRQLSEENARLLAQARQDAQTKTILLHEVNHRVKNNLASIIGLIQAQERFGKKKGSPEFRSMCRDLSGRVQGLAMAHNLLSAAGWSSVKLADLATEVIYSTLQILPSEHSVSVYVSPSSIHVTPDQANTLALVINELATNTIKHGQKGKEAPAISVLVEEKNGQILFEFQDNGSGYPEPILDEGRYDVGLHLVTNLVRRELRGEVTLRNDHGAVTRIQFGNRRS
jgi:PAS domain S-box-containing protein